MSVRLETRRIAVTRFLPHLLRGDAELVVHERPRALVHVQERVDVRRVRRDVRKRVGARRRVERLFGDARAIRGERVRPIFFPALEIHARASAARVDRAAQSARAPFVTSQARLLRPRGRARRRVRGRKRGGVRAGLRRAPRLVKHRRVALEHVAVARPAVRAQVAPRVIRAHAVRREKRHLGKRATGGGVALADGRRRLRRGGVVFRFCHPRVGQLRSRVGG